MYVDGLVGFAVVRFLLIVFLCSGRWGADLCGGSDSVGGGRATGAAGVQEAVSSIRGWQV